MKSTSKSEDELPMGSPGMLAYVASERWQNALSTELSGTKITALEVCLLAAIQWLQGRQELVMQTQVASVLGMDVMLVSKYLRQLEAQKLVRRQKHATDGRARNVSLTSSGLRIVQDSLQAFKQANLATFGSASAQKKVERALDKVVFR